jgi:hypothetical protein
MASIVFDAKFLWPKAGKTRLTRVEPNEMIEVGATSGCQNHLASSLTDFQAFFKSLLIPKTNPSGSRGEICHNRFYREEYVENTRQIKFWRSTGWVLHATCFKRCEFSWKSFTTGSNVQFAAHAGTGTFADLFRRPIKRPRRRPLEGV